MRGIFAERARGNPYHDTRGRFTNAVGQGGTREGGAPTRQACIIPRPGDAPPDHASLQEVERWLRMRHTDGTEVPLAPEDRARLRGMIFTHNHPQGLRFPEGDPYRFESSFSLDDVYSAALVRLAALRAVAPGYVFSLRPLDGITWPAPEQIEPMVNMIAEWRDREQTPQPV